MSDLDNQRRMGLDHIQIGKAAVLFGVQPLQPLSPHSVRAVAQGVQAIHQGALRAAFPESRDIVSGSPDFMIRDGDTRTMKEYGGDWSIGRYIRAMENENESERRAIMDEILRYNEEDLGATWAVFQ